MKRILVLVPFPMTDDELANRQAQAEAVDLAPDVEIHYRPVKAAPRTYTSQQDYVLADLVLLETGRSAQEDGFDAVCIDTVSDSGVAALRSVLDIPVIGPGRAMYATAITLGDKFSMLAMWKDWFGLYTKVHKDMGLSHKCASMRAIDVTPDNRNLLGGKEDKVFPLLLDTAKQCIEEDGADVICLGSTTMHQSATFLAENLPVPIINPGPHSYKMAEAAIALNLTQSRTAYPAPKVDKREMLHAMLDAAAAEQAGKPVEKLD